MNTSIINTGKNNKIFATNNINKIEVLEKNKIESDSDFREVIKKGYLLSQINLAEVPDIIKEAINQAILDAKNQTLSDALIQVLRDRLDSLDSGIYKKTYIDNTMSYIENIALSKVDSSTLAGIVSNQITYAISGLATTSQVSILNSRVGSSESEILNVKNTINTKDLARAEQITQLEASINETFAGYSEAIELYVDTDGNVKSEKIETLSTNIGLQIQEVNQLIVNTDNNWNAKSIKLITSPNGAITGYSFQDGSGLKSTFEINADNFEISNSYNTYSPFSIVGTSLYFNGKISFTNTTNVPDFALNSSVDSKINNLTKVESIPWQQEVQNAINNNATYIDGKKIVTNQALVNNLNATGGIIAETVTANEFVGKTFTGAVINGAVINGAVVKASYLDLDGELEVLTNYHITVAMYNANPSLYTDAVYMSGTNEYRIPSISIIKEIDSISNGNGCSIYGGIRSYNTANVGNNNKAVKVRPYFIISENVTLFNTSYSAEDTGKMQRGILYLGDILLIDASMSNNILTVNGTNYDMPDTDPNSSTNRRANITLTIYGLSITINAFVVGSGGGLISFSGSGLSIILNATTGTFLGTNFENTTRGFYIKDLSSVYSNSNSKSSCSISSKISINNMI